MSACGAAPRGARPTSAASGPAERAVSARAPVARDPAPALRREPLDDEIDGVADGLDRRGLLLAQLIP